MPDASMLCGCTNGRTLDGVSNSKLLQLRGCFDRIATDKQQHILGVPPGHRLLLPQPSAERVGRDIVIASANSIDPIRRPLLIDVVLASLIRNRGREQHGRREPCQRRHQRPAYRSSRCSATSRQTARSKLRSKRIGLVRSAARNSRASISKLAAIAIIAVNPKTSVRACRFERGRPRAGPASHVHHAARLQQLHHHGSHHGGRTAAQAAESN